MTRFLCTNCGFWQSHFAMPASCPICMDFRHVPPTDGFVFLTEAEVAHTARCSWADGGDGVTAFSCEPRFGIGPRGYFLRHPDGNVFFDGTGWYGPEALDWLASRGGVRWLSASHPHAYGALWQLQERSDPATVTVQVQDLPWTNAFRVTWPFDDRLELAPGLELIHTGGHFDGHTILYWEDRRTLFAGDMLKFHFAGERLAGISTHKAFNRRIPLSHAEVARYRAVVEPLRFDTVYTTFDRAACTRDMALRLFDAQLAGPPFFGPYPVPEATP